MRRHDSLLFPVWLGGRALASTGRVSCFLLTPKSLRLSKYIVFPECKCVILYLYITKGVGSNGDGTIQFLCSSQDKQAKVRRLM